MIKRLGIVFAIGMVLFFCETMFSQVDCSTVQCDCENILGGDKDPGLIALCKYYEEMAKEACEKGQSELKCHHIAKGPRSWPMKQLTKLKEIEKKNIETIQSPSPIKYCDELPKFLKEKGKLLRHIKRTRRYPYFKMYFQEALAYHYKDVIYVVISRSIREVGDFIDQDKYAYVYCDVSVDDWRKFRDVCSDCNYDDRFERFIKKYECDCL